MRKAAILFFSGLTVAASAQAPEHRKGPDGLEAWLVQTKVATLENQGPLPTQLIIARHGKVIRKLDGLKDSPANTNGPFIFTFMLLPDGKRIAFEHGPLHFSSTCTLMDISSGKHLEDYDCWSDLAPDAPSWVRDLVAVRGQ